LNNSSIADIKACELRKFPEPCIVEFVDPEFGATKVVVSTIKDYKDEIVFFTVIKERFGE